MADSEALYDRYLDACLAGAVEDPQAFFARHPELDPDGRARIESLHRVLEAGGTPQADVLPFERLAGYRLIRRLGAGGMGTVYLAEQEALRRLVALKIIRPELRTSATATRRFEREAMSIARLRHPHVVRVHELGEEGDVAFLAMEFVPGRTLGELIAEGPPVLSRVLRWAEELSRALFEAHRHGIVHRDVKPGNVLITPEDRAVLLDFGMAHLIESESSRLTRSFAGSPSYAAPEQLNGREEVDGRTDVYGLGVTLYECLTGRLPFGGGPLEEVFQRILRDEPPPPRRFDPALPADVETVTLKAMAKRPEARYATAEELAADLRALREARKVKAKPPSLVARAGRWARRRPARATALVMLLLSLLVVGAGVLVQRRGAARAAVVDASRRVDAWRADRARWRELQTRFTALQARSQDSYLAPAKIRELDRLSREVDALRRRRESAFYEVLELLRRAERLHPGVDGTDEVRARLYQQKMEESYEAQDLVAADFYRELVRKLDPTGELTSDARLPARLTVETQPRGAELYLFRERELRRLAPEGEPRVVPVPEAGAPPPLLARGGLALRVVRGAGPLAVGDFVIAIAGRAVRGDDRPLGAGVSVTRYRVGEETEVVTAAGTLLRATATPLLASPRCRIGVSPIAGHELAPGEYRVWIRADGREPVVVPFRVAPDGNMALEVTLPRLGAAPPDFVYVAASQGRRPYWIQAREVTCGEYLEFLNDPSTLARIAASESLLFAPRSPESETRGGDWPRGDDGRYSLPGEWLPDWPVLGVSWHDAVAYAEWRARRDGRAFALPTREEWTYAADGAFSRPYPFGHVFRPQWVKSCYSRPQPAPEPVLRYPVDESPFGAFDMTGSASEWMDDWYDAARGRRRLGGSSWAHATPDLFRVWAGTGAPPGSATHTFGFRLVLREAPR